MELAHLMNCKGLSSPVLGTPSNEKSLSYSALLLIINSYPSPSHDDFLFIAQLLTGCHTLLQLGEMVFPDKIDN
jgi:hypothetical protein